MGDDKWTRETWNKAIGVGWKIRCLKWRSLFWSLFFVENGFVLNLAWGMPSWVNSIVIIGTFYFLRDAFSWGWMEYHMSKDVIDQTDPLDDRPFV